MPFTSTNRKGTTYAPGERPALLRPAEITSLARAIIPLLHEGFLI